MVIKGIFLFTTQCLIAPAGGETTTYHYQCGLYFSQPLNRTLSYNLFTFADELMKYCTGTKEYAF